MNHSFDREVYRIFEMMNYISYWVCTEGTTTEEGFDSSYLAACCMSEELL
jgi:hypothetical protein